MHIWKHGMDKIPWQIGWVDKSTLMNQMDEQIKYPDKVDRCPTVDVSLLFKVLQCLTWSERKIFLFEPDNLNSGGSSL